MVRPGDAEFDVLVVGAGNAALCAALAAAEKADSVGVLEWAPESERGGNSAYAGGTFRIAYESLEHLLAILDLSEEEISDVDFGSYPATRFFEDLGKVTNYRYDPDLAETLVAEGRDTVTWMHGKGVPFVPAYGKYAGKLNGKRGFRNGVVVEAAGGGLGLTDSLVTAVEKAGVRIAYGQRAVELLRDGPDVVGVVADADDGRTEWRSRAVILACGGYESNPEWRARYLGRGWDLAKVRGTRFNMGDGIRMALEAGAMPFGNWSGCHAVSWDLNAPLYGDRAVGDGFSRHGYHFGLMVNAYGRRFLDEGADSREFTYAKYGALVLEQPGQFAWQIFDAKVADLLRHDLYRSRYASRVTADTLEDLVEKLDGVDARQCLETLRRFNDAVGTDTPFNAALKDGRHTTGIEPPKSNWANALDTPPYEAFPVTCGVTFTFGGIRIDGDARVLDMSERPIPGLFAAGEMAAGIFMGNYPGSTGLAWGAVMGRRAGYAAARLAAA